MITVETIKLKDIKDNDLLYVVVKNNGQKEAISVGVKTFTRIQELINGKQPELPYEVDQNQFSSEGKIIKPEKKGGKQ